MIKLGFDFTDSNAVNESKDSSTLALGSASAAGGMSHMLNKNSAGNKMSSNSSTPNNLDPREARAQSMQRCVKSLEHASKCRDANCKIPSCAQMKKIKEHTQGCVKKLTNECPTCKQLLNLCCFHAKSCTSSNCPVILCANIKAKMQLRRRQTEAHALRRMNAMNMHAASSVTPPIVSRPPPPQQQQPQSTPHTRAIQAAQKIQQMAAAQHHAYATSSKGNQYHHQCIRIAKKQQPVWQTSPIPHSASIPYHPSYPTGPRQCQPVSPYDSSNTLSSMQHFPYSSNVKLAPPKNEFMSTDASAPNILRSSSSFSVSSSSHLFAPSRVIVTPSNSGIPPSQNFFEVSQNRAYEEAHWYGQDNNSNNNNNRSKMCASFTRPTSLQSTLQSSYSIRQGSIISSSSLIQNSHSNLIRIIDHHPPAYPNSNSKFRAQSPFSPQTPSNPGLRFPSSQQPLSHFPHHNLVYHQQQQQQPPSEQHLMPEDIIHNSNNNRGNSLLLPPPSTSQDQLSQFVDNL